MTRATRELILQGRAPQPFAVPALDGAEVVLRALSASEAEDVQALEVEGISATQAVGASAPAAVGQARPRGTSGQTMEIAFDKVIRGTHRALIAAAAYGLVEPALTRAEVENIRPAEVVEQIGREVMARSGLGQAQAAQLREFRDDSGGSDDADPAPLRIAADDDAA